MSLLKYIYNDVHGKKQENVSQTETKTNNVPWDKAIYETMKLYQFFITYVKSSYATQRGELGN